MNAPLASIPLTTILAMFKFVDEFEDKVENQGFYGLVSQQLMIALEDQIFGWTHLSSSIIGHVSITSAAYFATYSCLGLLNLAFFWNRTVELALRAFVSLLVALMTFRLVQRRRSVWLPSTYGSQDYLEDHQRRHKEVAATDYSTLLGHLRRKRDSFLNDRIEKTLTEAEVAFRSFQQEGRQVPRTSYQTFPTNQTQSIENDQVTFPCIQIMPYSHGGFFGAAPFLLANPDWISKLRKLMPDVYVEISRRILKAPAQKLIHWAENNPVVAAYGMANELQNAAKMVPLEWDVFLDPQLVRRVERVRSQLATLKSASSILDRSAEQHEQIQTFLEEELERRSAELVDKMMIAHGDLSQLLMEQSGIAKDYIYSRVKRTRRTLGGGMYARQWMAVYAEALRLGMTLGEHHIRNSTAPMDPPHLMEVEDNGQNRERNTNESTRLYQACTSTPITTFDDIGTAATLSALSSLACPNTSIKESVDILRRVIKVEAQSQPIGLILDLKSRHVPKSIWSIVVNQLVAAGIRVEGVGSFTAEDVRDLGSLCHEPICEIMFFHSAGDLQHACHSGSLREGDSVFLNGGSLLWEANATSASLIKTLAGEFDPKRAMQEYRLLSFCSASFGDDSRSTLAAYQEKLNLKIGLYVQEFNIDEAALNVLVNFSNENPSLLQHGMTWGGLNGVTVGGIQPGRFTCTDGFHTQRYAGRSWDPSLSADNIVIDA